MHYLLSFFIAAVLALVTTPLAIYISIKKKIFDRPGLRKVHEKAMPCLGGAAIMVTVLAGLWLSRLLWPAMFAGLTGKLVAFTAGGLLIFGIGLYDDLRDSPVLTRLLFQFTASGILVAGGFCITVMPNLLGGNFQLGIFSIPFTMLWIVFLINAMNFIDGLDGLAAGIALISAGTIFISASSHGEGFIAILAVLLVGAMLGFLPFNFHPAKIFMGDSGATFIGFLLAAMTTLGTMKSIATIALLIPIAALGVPIIDTVSAIVRRTWRGQMFYQADKEHVHHTLISMGFSHQEAVMFLYGISAFLSVMAILLSSADRRMISIMVGLFLILMWVFLKRWQRSRNEPD